MFDRFANGALFAIGFACVFSLVLLIGSGIENRVFPVLRNMEVMELERNGETIRFKGTVVKERSCEYIAPWRAVAVPSGRHLRVEHEMSDRPNWPTGKIQFAWVTVYDVGNESVAITSEHRCHVGPTVMSNLGIVGGGK